MIQIDIQNHNHCSHLCFYSPKIKNILSYVLVETKSNISVGNYQILVALYAYVQINQVFLILGCHAVRGPSQPNIWITDISFFSKEIWYFNIILKKKSYKLNDSSLCDILGCQVVTGWSQPNIWISKEPSTPLSYHFCLA